MPTKGSGRSTTCGHYPHEAKGLCKACYNAHRHQLNPEKGRDRARAWRAASKKARTVLEWVCRPAA